MTRLDALFVLNNIHRLIAKVIPKRARQYAGPSSSRICTCETVISETTVSQLKYISGEFAGVAIFVFTAVPLFVFTAKYASLCYV